MVELNQLKQQLNIIIIQLLYRVRKHYKIHKGSFYCKIIAMHNIIFYHCSMCLCPPLNTSATANPLSYFHTIETQQCRHTCKRYVSQPLQQFLRSLRWPFQVSNIHTRIRVSSFTDIQLQYLLLHQQAWYQSATSVAPMKHNTERGNYKFIVSFQFSQESGSEI